MADYKFSVDAQRCMKCGLCIAFCPCELLAEDENGNPFAKNPEACVGCQTCSGNCPTRSIKVETLGGGEDFDPYMGEEPVESITKELQAEYAEYQKTIMKALGLRWQPVAVSLIKADEPLPKAPIPNENMRFCQAMMAARRGA